MDALRWLMRALTQSAQESRPVLLFALLAALVGVAALSTLAPDRRVAARAALRAGWCFPAALLVVGFLGALLGGGQSQAVSLVGMALLASLVLAQLGWACRAVWRQRGARGALVALTLAQLAVTLVLLMPAMGLATGFGRTWL